MASLVKTRQHGRDTWRISFYSADGERKFIRLGELSKRAAETICHHVSQLASAKMANDAAPPATAAWLEGVGQELSDKLAGAGLIGERQSATLGAFLGSYVEGRTDAKPNTLRNLRASRKALIGYFGEGKNLRDISAGEAQEWKQSQLNAGLAVATVSRQVKHAKQFFKHASRMRFISANPFEEVSAGGERNDARLQFIDAATIQKVIAAAPDLEWRCILALARFGGVRCPSELLALKWSDIDWAQSRLTVSSPKTERQGKPYRVLPLFAELRPHLEAAFDAAPEGAIHVITRYRESNANLRTQLQRIIRRAGVEPWERLFHNLRASRQTELADSFPAHVVASWLGNSPQVAERHYLKTHEGHFARALLPFAPAAPQGGTGGGTTGGTIECKKVAQTVAPHAFAHDANRSEKLEETLGIVRNDSLACGVVYNYTVPPRGVEPLFSD